MVVPFTEEEVEDVKTFLRFHAIIWYVCLDSLQSQLLNHLLAIHYTSIDHSRCMQCTRMSATELAALHTQLYPYC